MKCHDVQSVLTLYASGDLDFREAVRVREHLQKCPDCALALDRERGIINLLGRAGRDRKTPDGALDEITARVMERLDEKTDAHPALFRRAPGWGRAKTVAALAALVIVSVILVIAVLPEQAPATHEGSAVPGFADKGSPPETVAEEVPTMFETWPGEKRLTPVRTVSDGPVRVPNWRYRGNWLERVETPEEGVRVLKTGGGSSF